MVLCQCRKKACVELVILHGLVASPGPGAVTMVLRDTTDWNDECQKDENEL